MSYKNGKDILPERLLNELQKYIQGELIYIPKHKERARWGAKNGTRNSLKLRNEEIYRSFENGCSIRSLMKTHNLSEDSIRKIIVKTRRELLLNAQ